MPSRAPAFPFGYLVFARLKAENVARRFHHADVMELGDAFFAQTINVKSHTRHEVDQALDDLRGTGQAAGAADDRFARNPLHARTAGRAVIRHDEWSVSFMVFLGDDRDDLGNDIPGTLNLYQIADADILALDLILIVQCGA